MVTTTSMQSPLAHYLALSDVGAFDEVRGRVELLGGNVVVTVNKGLWHGAVESNVIEHLNPPYRSRGYVALPATTAPLSERDAPDPDFFWVSETAKTLPERSGRLIKAFPPEDYVLVLEVADRSYADDTRSKAAMYAAGEIRQYWVVHRGGVAVFTDPTPQGYRTRTDHGPGERVTLPVVGGDVSVDELLAVPAWATGDPGRD